MKRRITIAAIATAAALTLTGCSAVDQLPESPETGGGTVTILTHDSFVITDEQIAAFEEQSSYTLQTTAPGDAGVVVNQLELAADNPTVDGVYGIDNYSAQTVIDGGFVAPYESPNLPASASEMVMGGALTPIDHGQVCVNIDHEWFAENDVPEPETLDDLATDTYAPLLVTTNPAMSSPGLAFLVATASAYGDDWQGYWEQLLENGTKVVAGWSDAYYVDFSGSEGEGEFPLVLSYSSSPAAAPGTGVLDATCTAQIEYAGVVEGAANPEGAQAFIDFLLTDEFQQTLPENMYMYSVNDELELPAEWAEHAQLADNPIEADPTQVAENREAWISEWTALFEAQN